MEYDKKTWKDRVSEFPTRRQLTDENDTQTLVTIARSEGTVLEEGDAFSASNMNDLEDRINDGLESISSDLSTYSISTNSQISTINANVSALSAGYSNLTIKLPYTIKYMSKSSYDSLSTKDSNTLYFIPE